MASGPAVPSVPPPPGPGVPFYEVVLVRVRQFLDRHGRHLWWVHSLYALAVGMCVITFARKGFLHARWLLVSLGLAWLLLLTFFRLHGSGPRQQRLTSAEPRARLRFLAMTYVLKNLYQGMLFFLLPFYFKSATRSAANKWFVLLLALCALLSTLDLVFDRFLMRWRALASVFYGLTLFACLNLVIPALLPNTRTLWTLLCAAGVTVVAFWNLHVPIGLLRSPRHVVLLVACMASGMTLTYLARGAIPPVPMYLSAGAVGPGVLTDGRLDMEVSTVHRSVLGRLFAVTDVVTPGGRGDRLQHVWRREGRELHRASAPLVRLVVPSGAVRLRSTLVPPPNLRHASGTWSVDVETQDGQLVGRTSFAVTE